jgi:hypothetical protein
MSCASSRAFACASGHELVSSIWSNNLYGESNVEWCQDRSCCCLRALHRWSWRKRDASASSRARMGGGCSGFQGTLGLRVRGANLGASASRGPAGLRRARMRYPGNSAGSCLAYVESRAGGYWYGVGLGRTQNAALSTARRGCGLGAPARTCRVVKALCG